MVPCMPVSVQSGGDECSGIGEAASALLRNLPLSSGAMAGKTILREQFPTLSNELWADRNLKASAIVVSVRKAGIQCATGGNGRQQQPNGGF